WGDTISCPIDSGIDIRFSILPIWTTSRASCGGRESIKVTSSSFRATSDGRPIEFGRRCAGLSVLLSGHEDAFPGGRGGRTQNAPVVRTTCAPCRLVQPLS